MRAANDYAAQLKAWRCSSTNTLDEDLAGYLTRFALPLQLRYMALIYTKETVGNPEPQPFTLDRHNPIP